MVFELLGFSGCTFHRWSLWRPHGGGGGCRCPDTTGSLQWSVREEARQGTRSTMGASEPAAIAFHHPAHTLHTAALDLSPLRPFN